MFGLDIKKIFGLAKTDCASHTALALQDQFQLGNGAINIGGVTGSPSDMPRSKRAIVVAMHGNGESSNYGNYGLTVNGTDGPEVAAMKRKVAKNPLPAGGVSVVKGANGNNVIFAATFLVDYELLSQKADNGEDITPLAGEIRQSTAKAIREATANALHAAEKQKLRHLDFTVMDGGFLDWPRRVLNLDEAARAMAQGMIDYARAGGKVTAAVIQYEYDGPNKRAAFAAPFHEAIASYRPVAASPGQQPATPQFAR